MNVFRLALLPLVLVACAPQSHPAPLPPLPVARVVVVEITDSREGTPFTDAIPLSLVEGHGWSVVELKQRSHRLKVEASSDTSGACPMVHVKVYRWREDEEQKDSSELAFSEHALWHPGERVFLGRSIARDGTRTEVAFSMR